MFLNKVFILERIKADKTWIVVELPRQSLSKKKNIYIYKIDLEKDRNKLSILQCKLSSKLLAEFGLQWIFSTIYS